MICDEAVNNTYRCRQCVSSFRRSSQMHGVIVRVARAGRPTTHGRKTAPPMQLRANIDDCALRARRPAPVVTNISRQLPASIDGTDQLSGSKARVHAPRSSIDRVTAIRPARLRQIADYTRRRRPSWASPATGHWGTCPYSPSNANHLFVLS